MATLCWLSTRNETRWIGDGILSAPHLEGTFPGGKTHNQHAPSTRRHLQIFRTRRSQVHRSRPEPQLFQLEFKLDLRRRRDGPRNQGRLEALSSFLRSSSTQSLSFKIHARVHGQSSQRFCLARTDPAVQHRGLAAFHPGQKDGKEMPAIGAILSPFSEGRVHHEIRS